MEREWFRDLMNEIRTEQSETRKTLSRIDVTLAAQHVTLEDHQRRSLANEELVETLRAEIKPLSLHVAIVNRMGAAIGGIGILIGIAEGVAHLFGWL